MRHPHDNVDFDNLDPYKPHKHNEILTLSRIISFDNLAANKKLQVKMH
jgi:hypothetical protein